MGQFLVRADDESLGRWKDEAKRRGVSFSAFVRGALGAYCEDGAIGDRGVEAEPPRVPPVGSFDPEEDPGSVVTREAAASSSELFEPLAGFDLVVRHEQAADPSALPGLSPSLERGSDVRDDTVARIFDKRPGSSSSRPGVSRVVMCEHRVPAGTFCKFGCDG